jgi:methylthioribose-1-phosphate isomerase
MAETRTLEWTGRAVRLLDQTQLPRKITYLTIRDEEAMWGAIKRLSVRGAPAIGVAALYGLYLGAARRKPATLAATRKAVKEVADYLATSRPTAVNLFWALDEGRRSVDALPAGTSAKDALAALLDKAKAIHRDDEQRCDAIARHGAPVLRRAKGVVTHCNTGALATAGRGTALAVILEAARRNPELMVFVDETRPLLQGARLTAWECAQAGVQHRLITDSMAATVLLRGMAQAVIAGSDRIAANGDAANKIGTMPLAIVAKHFKVPFYIAAPLSTFDASLSTGADIPIEERADEEITTLGGVATAPGGTRTFNPAFDVVPNALIAGIITEVGVLRAPYRQTIRKALAHSAKP